MLLQITVLQLSITMANVSYHDGFHHRTMTVISINCSTLLLDSKIYYTINIFGSGDPEYTIIPFFFRKLLPGGGIPTRGKLCTKMGQFSFLYVILHPSSLSILRWCYVLSLCSLILWTHIFPVFRPSMALRDLLFRPVLGLSKIHRSSRFVCFQSLCSVGSG